MKQTIFKRPLVRLPQGMDLTVFLIGEELKSRKFFNSLGKLGLDNCHYQPHLDSLIMAQVGLDDDRDETFDFYYNLIEKHSRKIQPDRNSISKHALKVYMELIATKCKLAKQAK